MLAHNENHSHLHKVNELDIETLWLVPFGISPVVATEQPLIVFLPAYLASLGIDTAANPPILLGRSDGADRSTTHLHSQSRGVKQSKTDSKPSYNLRLTLNYPNRLT